MNLCIFLAIGESWEDFEKKGQDELWLKNNLYFYSRNFTQVFVFSYGKKGGYLLPNVILIPNKFGLHRFIFAILLPVLQLGLIKQCSVIRGYQLTGAIPGIIAKVLYSKPLIINFGYDYVALAKIENKILHVFLFGIIEKILLYFCDAVIVPTPDLKKHVHKSKREDVYLIPNSLDTKLFSPVKKVKSIGAIYVGRLEKQKNLASLIVAWSGLEKKLIQLQLVFIGEGSLQKDLSQQAQQLEVPLVILNPKPHTLIPRWLGKARIFIIPSLIEGHPKALLEAMSCGLAVIGTNVLGINDVIENNITGILSKPDPMELCKNISRLLKSEKLRQKLGISARKYIVTQYNRDNIWNLEIKLLNKYAR